MSGAVVVGEALVDLLDAGTDAGPSRRPGGSPANVAVALARLGVPTTLVTAFADDEDGALLARHLEGVDVRRPATVQRTSTAAALLDADGVATYDICLDWDITGASALALDGAWMHIGSIAATEGPGCEEVLRLAERHEGRLSYDLNCRPAVMLEPARVLPAVERLVRLSDVVKLSEEDADWLYGGGDAIARLHELGAPLVVLTLGAQGCVASTGAERIAVPAAAGGPVRDTVGAGDAFMAGLVKGLLEGQELPQALELASLTARRTCERVGADPPTLAELRP